LYTLFTLSHTHTAINTVINPTPIVTINPDVISPCAPRALPLFDPDDVEGPAVVLDDVIELEDEGGNEDELELLVIGGKLSDVLEFPTAQNPWASFSAAASSVTHPPCTQETMSLLKFALI
jgi:hypothetical protein